ncbi:MAG: gluconolactonase [Blastopirellula sp.]|nr:MAG: gluconolactonase [Blastopirellula sp.]
MRWKKLILLFFLFTCVSFTQADDFRPTAQSQIISQDAKFETLHDQAEFTEGPAATADGKSIIFSDIGNRMLRYDLQTGKTSVFRDPSGCSNGLVFDQKGNLIACEGVTEGGGRRISITSPAGKVRTLADGWNGKRFNSPNDLAVDKLGRVYITDPRYRGEEPREIDFEGVFLIDTKGKVVVATKDTKKPNGILVSADQKTVFVGDNSPDAEVKRLLLSFRVKKDGTLTDRKSLFDFGAGRGIDGMALDTEGNIFATAGKDELSGIYVFSPTGKQLAMIPTPGAPTNCTFGVGKDAHHLYVTCANSKTAWRGDFGLYRIDVKKTGYHIFD